MLLPMYTRHLSAWLTWCTDLQCESTLALCSEATLSRRPQRALRFLSAVTLLTTFGCAPAPDAAPSGETTSELQTAELDARDRAVVGVMVEHGRTMTLCSGTLVAPNVVLTARHCIAPRGSDAVRCGTAALGAAARANSILVTTEPAFPSDPSLYIEAAKTEVPQAGDDVCGFDLATIVLATPVSAATATPHPPRLELAPQPDESYAAVGYGATCATPDDPSCNETPGTRRRLDNLRVACALCPNPNFTDTEWLGDRVLRRRLRQPGARPTGAHHRRRITSNQGRGQLHLTDLRARRRMARLSYEDCPRRSGARRLCAGTMGRSLATESTTRGGVRHAGSLQR